MRKSSIVIFGPGWLGHEYQKYFNATLSRVDITDASLVASVLEKENPQVVINTAGKTGRPNVDWCETHRQETIHSNVTGPLILANECAKRDIQFVHLSSGCIFNGESIGGDGFTEEDAVDPPSFYSLTKAVADSMLKESPALILRLRMPVHSRPNDRNLINKLLKYQEIVDVENSVTVIDDLLLATKHLIEGGYKGIYNIVNPGALLHSQLLEQYKKVIDASHSYRSITLEEFEKSGLVVAKRSNCILDTKKLRETGLLLPSIHERLPGILEEYKKHV